MQLFFMFLPIVASLIILIYALKRALIEQPSTSRLPSPW